MRKYFPHNSQNRLFGCLAYLENPYFTLSGARKYFASPRKNGASKSQGNSDLIGGK